MAYEYRRMTPQERAETVANRRARGYPLHAPPHPIRHGGWYFITGVNFEHQPIMASPARRDEFEGRLLEAFRSIDATIGGWVILPNHHHSLIEVDSLDSVSEILKQLHGATSREWNTADGMTGKRKVWYKFRDRWIRDERHYYQALNYIHYNPVKHNCVIDPYAWRWSSLYWYLDIYGRDWLRTSWLNSPVGNFGEGWDD